MCLPLLLWFDLPVTETKRVVWIPHIMHQCALMSLGYFVSKAVFSCPMFVVFISESGALQGHQWAVPFCCHHVRIPCEVSGQSHKKGEVTPKMVHPHIPETIIQSGAVQYFDLTDYHKPNRHRWVLYQTYQWSQSSGVILIITTWLNSYEILEFVL